MPGYDEKINRIADKLAMSQYKNSIMTPEVNGLQMDAMRAAGVDFDKLYGGSKEERVGEWAKIDTKKLGIDAADVALKRFVLTELKSYAGNFEEDTKKYRDGELEGDALDQYEAMLQLVRETGYDPESFSDALDNIKDTRNAAQALARNLQTMSGWRANGAAQDFLSRDIPRNYESWKEEGDQGPRDLTRRLNRKLDEESRKRLEDIV